MTSLEDKDLVLNCINCNEVRLVVENAKSFMVKSTKLICSECGKELIELTDIVL